MKSPFTVLVLVVALVCGFIFFAQAGYNAQVAGGTTPHNPPNTLDEYVLVQGAFNWVDISTNGTDTGMDGDDENIGPFNLGFSFPYYGNNYSSVRVCSNGWISFTDTNRTYFNSSLPSAAPPNNAIYPWWDDLTAVPYGTIRYLADTTNHRFIVSFHLVSMDVETPFYDFQVILSATGEIIFQYLNFPSSRAGSCTIGIENADGTEAVQVLSNGSGTEPRSGTAFLIYQPSEISNPSTAPAASFMLFPAFPNPFNAETRIAFELPVSARTTLDLFDVTGRKIRTLFDGNPAAGRHEILLNGSDLTTGTYLCRMMSGNRVATTKLMLLK
jgi:hypothetical protein